MAGLAVIGTSKGLPRLKVSTSKVTLDDYALYLERNCEGPVTEQVMHYLRGN